VFFHVYGVIAILFTAILSAVQAPVGFILNYSSGDFQVFASQGRHAASAFFVKEYFPVPSSGGNQCKKPACPHLAFWLITKLKCAII